MARHEMTLVLWNSDSNYVIFDFWYNFLHDFTLKGASIALSIIFEGLYQNMVKGNGKSKYIYVFSQA